MRYRIWRKAQGMRNAESDEIEASSLEEAEGCAGDWASELVESWVDPEEPLDGPEPSKQQPRPSEVDQRNAEYIRQAKANKV